MTLALVLLGALTGVPPRPTCLADTTAPALLAVERVAEIVTRRDGGMALKRRILSLPHVSRSEIRVQTSGRICRNAEDAYRRSHEMGTRDSLADLVVLKIAQERYVVVAVDRMDSRDPSWAVYNERWEEVVLFRTP